MPANLFQDKMVTYRTPAWHDVKGVRVFNDPMTCTQAAQLAGVLFELRKEPLHVLLPGRVLKVPNYAAIVRSAHDDMPDTYLDVCKEGYPILQNAELCAMLDPISQEWPVESIGALGEGEQLVLSLNMGGMAVAGEDYTNTFGLHEWRDGGHNLRCMFTSTRIVCANTALMAWQEASFRVEIPHTRDFRASTEWHLELMQRMRQVADTAHDQWEALAKVRVDSDTVDHIVGVTYPEPSTPDVLTKIATLSAQGVDVSDLEAGAKERARTFLRETELAQEHRVLAVALYDRLCDEAPKIGGTAWGLYQAVVEAEDHRKGRGDRAFSSLFGERARVKGRAYAALTGLLD